METHHPHHVTHKKKWTEYLLEFFMLFLAVFLGFVAENVRENIVERRLEKHYMHSMIEDLQKDTAMLNGVITKAERVTDFLDSASQILLTGSLNDSLIKKLYRYNLNMLPSVQIIFTDRTTSQLKNAGGLHTLKNTVVVEHLFAYWNKTDIMKSTSENVNELRMHARERSYNIFNAKYYHSGRDHTNVVVDSNPGLMTTDMSVLGEYGNRISHLKNGNLNIYLPNLKETFSTAVKLIGVIKKEYHFKE